MGTVPVDLVDVGLRALPVVIHLFFSEAYMALPKLCFLLIDSIISVNILSCLMSSLSMQLAHLLNKRFVADYLCVPWVFLEIGGGIVAFIVAQCPMDGLVVRVH